MPRQAREKSNTGIYHLILRGINRQNIFENDEDRNKFIKVLSYYKTISDYELYGYCLMDNHIHLLIKENIESISNIIKRISSSYVSWYNKKYHRCGHLFQERFKSEVVESEEYFITVLRYIHQNPIKAKISNDVKVYPWISYNEYLHSSKLIDSSIVLGMFSNDLDKAKKLYKEYMNKETKDKCLEYKEKIPAKDSEVIACFHGLGINSVSDLQQLEKRARDEIINKVKQMDNVTIRQLARITGISKSVIDRI